MRRALAVALAACLTGCALRGWEVQRGSGPESTIRAVSSKKLVRLELLSGPVVVLYDVRIVGDSVTGNDLLAQGFQRRAYALADVRNAEREIALPPRGPRPSLIFIGTLFVLLYSGAFRG